MSARTWIGAVALLAAALGACDVDDTVTAPVVDAAVGGGGSGGQGDAGPDAAPGGCQGDDDRCADPTGRCRADGVCVACLDAADCPAARPVCDGQNTCVPVGQGACREAFDCPVAQPQCALPDEGAVGVCVACFDDSDCEGGARPLCSAAGRCVRADAEVLCAGDAECGPGRRCMDGGCEFP
ncbi:MAG: hypothetical protein KC613_02830 [Myxococcales bacterium]|nr:hypothetical protein [Myxococcales bacterium]MCB9525767.1 hypothetical protein [Myxococcales bacterium]